ncbi:MAG: serine/threonine protein kinase [Deltaproteobacteria bacterium]|nr:serine/threonine protein kinase [Deltaproteobacteria bacterium]
MFRPTTFGKYVLLKRIAIGGMAEVFRAKAFGSEGFEKVVAIKRMLSHLSEDSQFVDMFINEAKLAASLSHANIVQIYDFGCIDNQYFLSMEYVHGKDVADIIRMLREQGLETPIELACHVIIEALNGLDYAHRQTDPYGQALGLIHRDMSPHNILVSFEGEVKIADFGIAKAKSSNVHTMGGVLKGKYSYMSPEQAHGMKLDRRSDVFSLGICMYELLTLNKMFQGQSDLNVLEKVRETSFIPPRELNPDITPELERLLLSALEKNPDDRYHTAADWREGIESFLIGQNMHFSSAWLASFMKELFQDQIARSQRDFAEEAELAQKLRTNARKVAQFEVIRDTVVLKSGHRLEGLPPIREVGLPEDESSSWDTARAARPLGLVRAERERVESEDLLTSEDPRPHELDAIEEVHESDIREVSEEDFHELASEGLHSGPAAFSEMEESLPTVEYNRDALVFDELDATARERAAGRPPIREVPSAPPIEEAVTLDERGESRSKGNTGEHPLEPAEFEEDLPTLKQRGRKTPKPRVFEPVIMEDSTYRPGGRAFPWGGILVVLVLALGGGGLFALWFHDGEESGGGEDAGVVPADIAPVGPVEDQAERDGGSGDRIQPFIFDAGLSSEKAEQPDAGSVAVVEPDKPPPSKKKTKRRRKRRLHGKNSCPDRGYGKLDVGVNGSWAYVFIDGKKERTTPMYQYRIKAGRHTVDLRDQNGRVIRSWSICVKANKPIRLFHQ